MQAAELGAFLRSRRERLGPGDVGFPAAARRRAPGLRREELAVLAGIGVSWLARLEQGRAPRVSDQVLERLADVLRLDGAERAHLFTLAHAPTGPGPAPLPPEPTDRDRALLAALEPNPAYLLDEAWDAVAYNRAEARLFPMLDEVDGPPNLLRLMLGDPALAAMQVDWEAEVDTLIRQFRRHLADHPSPRGRALVAELTERHPRFARSWARHDVGVFQAKDRVFDHPRAGRLRFAHHRFAPLDRPGWQLVVYVPDPATDTARRLARLLAGG